MAYKKLLIISAAHPQGQSLEEIAYHCSISPLTVRRRLSNLKLVQIGEYARAPSITVTEAQYTYITNKNRWGMRL